MSNILLRALGHNRVTDKTYIEDVFSAYTYTGNGLTQTITTGVDADLVWLKHRSFAGSHALTDTINGATTKLFSDGTTALQTSSGDISAFNSNGFNLTLNDGSGNQNNYAFISWSFAQADKFFKVVSAVKVAGVDKTVDLSSLGTVGMIVVKRTDAAGNWFVWHRSCTAGKLLYLNLTDAEAILGHITVSGTTLTLVNGVIADGTYIIYAWAHNTGADGLIQCGSLAVASPTNQLVSVTLGWEPQFILAKNKDHIGGWVILDTARYMSVASDTRHLDPNTSNAEASAGVSMVYPTATGFQFNPDAFWGNTAGNTVVFCAIRRGPMKLPTSGTQVYKAITNRVGTDAAAIITGIGFPPDLFIPSTRDTSSSNKPFFDRLRGVGVNLLPANTNVEASSPTDVITSFNMDGISVGADATYQVINKYYDANRRYGAWFFRRYPGVFDEVCYTGIGSSTNTQSHNLTVIPELLIIKNRTYSTSGDWWTFHTFTVSNAKRQILDTTAAQINFVYDGFLAAIPTVSSFSLKSGSSATNENGVTYVAYLFATLVGISKVGSFTKVAGAALNVDCGFSTGARFILLKRTDSIGDWYVYDSVIGIVAGNDPYLLLNLAGAVVTGTDYIDPLNAGFTVVDNGLANGSYIFFSVS